jgi:hypothetical protein
LLKKKQPPNVLLQRAQPRPLPKKRQLRRLPWLSEWLQKKPVPPLPLHHKRPWCVSAPFNTHACLIDPRGG